MRLIPQPLKSTSVGRALIDCGFMLCDVLRLDPGPRADLSMCLSLKTPKSSELTLPQGYSLRLLSTLDECTPSDVQTWINVLTESGFADANRGTFARAFAAEQLLGLYFLKRGSNTVGVCGVTRLQPSHSPPIACTVTYVAIVPSERGFGMGRVLVSTALRHARRCGAETAFLTTQDNRLSAIKTYLPIGFRPCLSSWDQSHRRRWKMIASKVGGCIEYCCLHGDLRGC